MAQSLKEQGLIHPIVLNLESDGRYVLIAGERRYRSSFLVPLTWTNEDETRAKTYESRTGKEHPSRIIQRGQIPFTLRENLLPIEQKEIELEENLRRSELSWEERIELLRQIDEIKKKVHGEGGRGVKDPEAWTTAKTGALVNLDPGHTGKAIELAKKLQVRPDLKKRLSNLGLSAAIKEAERIEIAENATRLHESGLLKIEQEFLLGDSRELIKKVKSNSIDLLLTDPPFGIPEITENEGQNRGSTQSYQAKLFTTDNLDATNASELLEVISKDFARVLKPGAHFYIFFSWDIFEALKQSLLRVGLEFQPYPIIWDKGKATGAFNGYNYPSSFEPILFGWKPERSKRLTKSVRNVIQMPPCGHSKSHPFQKPLPLLELLISQSTNLGDRVLDTFAGTANTIIAARNIGRSAVGFEVNQEHWVKGQVSLGEEKKEGEK